MSEETTDLLARIAFLESAIEARRLRTLEVLTDMLDILEVLTDMLAILENPDYEIPASDYIKCTLSAAVRRLAEEFRGGES